MASMNKVLLLGNLGRDPELRSTPKGNKVLNFPMATSRRWKDRESNASFRVCQKFIPKRGGVG